MISVHIVQRDILLIKIILSCIKQHIKDEILLIFKFFPFFKFVLCVKMSTSEKPRDVSGVELLMNNHQGHKAEIDTREDIFGDVYSLGKELLSR